MSFRPRILIVSQLFEPSVDKVAAHLDRKGASWARVNTETYPIGMTGCWSSGSCSSEAMALNTDGRELDLTAVTAVWFRRAPHPILPKAYSADTRGFIEGESAAFFHGLFATLSHAFWINSVISERAASNKIHQLRQARAIGLNIPETLVSNAPETVREFIASVDGPVIFKPLSGFSTKKNKHAPAIASHYAERYGVDVEEDAKDESDVVFAKIVDDYVLQNLESVRLSPVIFQKYIEKKSDIRVTAFGGVFFACEIHSQEHEETRVDFRRMTVSGKGFPPHEKIILPTELEAKVKRLLKVMDLEFGCIDLVRTKDDEYYFLEVNPAGQWLWIESLLKVPISEYLADYLIEHAH